MHPKALALIEKERVGVIAVTLADGTPHVAEVHYSQTLEPVKFFIQTSPTVKVAAIQERGGEAKAGFVLGLDEKDFASLQMRGDVRIVIDPNELENIYRIHYAKQPKAEQYKDDNTVFLEFTPIWWRYTDFKAHPNEKYSSDDDSAV